MEFMDSIKLSQPLWLLLLPAGLMVVLYLQFYKKKYSGSFTSWLHSMSRDVYRHPFFSYVTPAQAEKKLKPLVDKSTWGLIEKEIVRKEGKPTLVPLSDSRPALPTTAAEVFKPIADQSGETETEAVASFLL